MNGFAALVALTRTAFNAPSFAIFKALLEGWVLAPGRRTIAAIISVADPTGRRAHDAYHRFVRDWAWAMARLWRAIAVHAVARFAPAGVVASDCDDTLFHKTGRRIDGAGVFRDAVRSSASHRLRLRVEPGRGHLATTPWGGCSIAIPIDLRVQLRAGRCSGGVNT